MKVRSYFSGGHSGRREAAIYDVQLHIGNLEIPGLVLAHHPGMTARSA
jgi:hypothetical protein